MPIVHKALAYVVRGRGVAGELLVCEHRDSAGAGVWAPSGTVGHDERPRKAAIRQTCRDTGVCEAAGVRYLRTYLFQREPAGAWHQRHVFVVRPGARLPHTWNHTVPAEGTAAERVHTCSWLDLATARRVLADGQGDSIDLLRDRLDPQSPYPGRFIGEPIEVAAAAMSARVLATHQPPPPPSFRWGGRIYHIDEVLGQERKLNREGYVQAHDYDVRTSGGARMVLRCERSTRGGQNPWRLHVIYGLQGSDA